MEFNYGEVLTCVHILFSIFYPHYFSEITLNMSEN